MYKIKITTAKSIALNMNDKLNHLIKKIEEKNAFKNVFSVYGLWLCRPIYIFVTYMIFDVKFLK